MLLTSKQLGCNACTQMGPVKNISPEKEKSNIKQTANEEHTITVPSEHVFISKIYTELTVWVSLLYNLWPVFTRY